LLRSVGCLTVTSVLRRSIPHHIRRHDALEGSFVTEEEKACYRPVAGPPKICRSVDGRTYDCSGSSDSIRLQARTSAASCHRVQAAVATRTVGVLFYAVLTQLRRVETRITDVAQLGGNSRDRVTVSSEMRETAVDVQRPVPSRLDASPRSSWSSCYRVCLIWFGCDHFASCPRGMSRLPLQLTVAGRCSACPPACPIGATQHAQFTSGRFNEFQMNTP